MTTADDIFPGNEIIVRSEAVEYAEQYAKSQSILFIQYERRYRKEEGARFRKDCEKVGGMFTLADVGLSKIYDDFANLIPIESVSMPGVIYKYDEGKEVAWHGDKKL